MFVTTSYGILPQLLTICVLYIRYVIKVHWKVVFFSRSGALDYKFVDETWKFMNVLCGIKHSIPKDWIIIMNPVYFVFHDFLRVLVFLP